MNRSLTENTQLFNWYFNEYYAKVRCSARKVKQQDASGNSGNNY